ncbi:MAG: hypothetical protein E7655_00750 [Ruminococcaceae bacterium]|nr:hypothetical protein [Oscillospiraceae bacterium]
MMNKTNPPDLNDREDIRIDRYRPVENPFYIVKSKHYRAVKFTVLLIFVVYLLAMVTIFRHEITIENFRYLLKDIEFTRTYDADGYSRIAFDDAENADFQMYKGDFAVSDATGLDLYSVAGSKTFSADAAYANPVMLAGTKYLLLYGLSEFSYTVYNNFGQLYTESFPYPITNACLTDDGYYAIVTRTAEYRSAVYVYNSSFDRITSIYKDKYIIDVDMDSESKQVLLLSTYAEGGEFVSELASCSFDSTEEKAVYSARDCMPLEVCFRENGAYTVLFDSYALFYDENGVQVGSASYNGRVPITVAYGADRTVIAYNQNLVDSTALIAVYDGKGNVIHQMTEKGSVVKMISAEEGVYVLIGSRVIFADASSFWQTQSYAVERNAIDLVRINAKSFFVCYKNSATVFMKDEPDA